jgi:hypothetical protein
MADANKKREIVEIAKDITLHLEKGTEFTVKELFGKFWNKLDKGHDVDFGNNGNVGKGYRAWAVEGEGHTAVKCITLGGESSERYRKL